MSTQPETQSPPQSPPPTGHVLETGKRFSESILWQLQRQYYDQRGFSAWDTGAVPSYVTSNTFIAQAYANVVLSYLRDCMKAGQTPAEKPAAAEKPAGPASPVSASPAGVTAPPCAIDPTQPIYIVELAAGHGRFSYLFLKKFFALLRASSLSSLDVRYVMTDFTMSNVQTWARQKLFKPFWESGQLDFGLFDLENSEHIQLLREKRDIKPGELKNPIVVIANYIFDTVIQDVFRVENGKLFECLLTTTYPQPQAPDLTNPEIMSQFTTTLEQRPIATSESGPTPVSYYGDPALDRTLERYRQRLTDSTVVFPIGALRGLTKLLSLSGQRMMLLSSDKGYTHEDELFYLNGQHIQYHGSLSMMVNYHAIGEFFRHRGGHSVSTSQRQLTLKTSACFLGGSSAELADTMLAFREHIEQFGPCDFHTLLTNLRPLGQSGVSAEMLLTMLRMAGWDANVFFDFGRNILEQAQNANDALRLELLVALEKLWENYYPLGRDLPFELARVFLALKRPREALRFNALSIEMFGEHAVTWCNTGICHYQAEQHEEALRCFDRSLALNPDYGLARAWKVRVLSERERRTLSVPAGELTAPK